MNNTPETPTARAFSAQAVAGLPEIAAGDDLAALIAAATAAGPSPLEDGDIVVLAQKVVSKAEGRSIALANVQANTEAHDLAAQCGKDPRLVQLILDESERVVRLKPGVMIVRHRLGLVMAQAGIDRSNVRDGEALLLPVDPDASAQQLRERLQSLAGCRLGVVISDSFGRAWRNGTVNVAIGAAGITSLWDRRGERDRGGRSLESTLIAWADAAAAAAGLLMGEADEGIPVVILKGLPSPGYSNPAAALIRPVAEDMFL